MLDLGFKCGGAVAVRIVDCGGMCFGITGAGCLGDDVGPVRTLCESESAAKKFVSSVSACTSVAGAASTGGGINCCGAAGGATGAAIGIATIGRATGIVLLETSVDRDP